MRVSILLAPKGYYRVLIPQNKITKWVNFALQSKAQIEILDGQISEDSKTALLVSASDYHLITGNFAGELGDIERSEIFGWPRIFAWLWERIGLLIGGVFGVMIFILLSSFIWEVRIVGAQGYDEELIAFELAQLGAKEGAFIPKLDLDSVSSAYLENSQQMSWMNIYRKGTVLIVSCQPLTQNVPILPDVKNKTVNLIATRDAIVEELLLESGRAIVAKGTVVKKGDLLVSGIYENSIGYFFADANGQVMGKVSETIEVFVPFESVILTEENSRFLGIGIQILGRDFTFVSKVHSDAGIIVDKRQVYLFDRIRLPLSITLYQSPKTSEKVVSLSETEVVKLCYKRLEEEIGVLLAEAELISKKTSGSFTEDGFLLKCEISYIENIAEAIEFSVN